MKAVRIHAYGHSDQIHVEDVTEPSAEPGAVVVRIHDAGINPVDWKVREGFMAKLAPRTFPFTLGQDFCGEIVQIGDEVTGFSVGDLVYGFANGAYAEYALVSPTMIARAPKTIDEPTAAGLPTPAVTALQIVRNVIAPRQANTVLIHGAGGGVGSIATQLCVARGGRVFATAANKDADYLRQLGVDRVIDYQSQRFEDEIHDVDAVIDLVGGATLARSYQVVSHGGVVATTVGPIGEAEAERHGVRAIQIIMQKNGADLAEIARLVDQGIVKPRPAIVMPLTEASMAQDLNQSGKASEKLVLTVG